MKFLLLTGVLFSSLSAFACPDLTGKYISPDDEQIVLKQSSCNEINVQSSQINQTIILNNEYVVVQDNDDLVAQGRGAFSGETLVIEVKVKYKYAPPVPRMFLPVKALIKYNKLPDGNLVEGSTVYNDSNGIITTDKIIYKKK